MTREERTALVNKQAEILKANGIQVIEKRALALMVVVAYNDLEKAQAHKIDGVKIARRA